MGLVPPTSLPTPGSSSAVSGRVKIFGSEAWVPADGDGIGAAGIIKTRDRFPAPALGGQGGIVGFVLEGFFEVDAGLDAFIADPPAEAA